jgi:hypothetical protein
MKREVSSADIDTCLVDGKWEVSELLDNLYPSALFSSVLSCLDCYNRSSRLSSSVICDSFMTMPRRSEPACRLVKSIAPVCP